MLSLGFSPCPNDTFIFHALVHGLVPGPQFAPPLLADVETLNKWALVGKLDVTKLSFHAYGLVQDEYELLAAGSALGRGCGPLLVAREQDNGQDLGQATIAIPGIYTTASLLLRMYGPSGMKLRAMDFSQIMPKVASGEVDYGVIIHESRFTYADYGLRCVQDLGQWWEDISGLPIPLGGIVARKSLGETKIREISNAIKASVSHAFAQPDIGLPYIAKHAQEIAESVMRDHIALYVNDFTLDLGGEGWAAIKMLLRQGQEKGIF